MECPHCGEKFRLWQAVKLYLYLKLPCSWHERLEQRKEAADLQRLKHIYKITAEGLTMREHTVCIARVHGRSYEQVAQNMNVTQERIKQIQAKALRKLSREHENDF